MLADRHPKWLALGAVAALLAAGQVVVGTTTSPAHADDHTVTWTDDFDGSTLDPRWQVVNEDPSALSVADGELVIEGQLGDTWQGTNTAKNLVMVDVPAGDFTATTTVSAPVAKVFQGAGLIAWQDFDNYVRSGLTFVGTELSPSGTAIENDVETGASFSAVQFTDRPGSTGETLRLQRTGDTITTSYLDAGTGNWLPAGSTTVGFDVTQVGLYALAAQDGTVLRGAFDSFTVEHQEGADVVPSRSFVLQATGDAPYLLADGSTLRLTDDRPTTSLRLAATDLGDGALAIRTLAGQPLLLTGGALVLGGTEDEPTPLRISDAGGGKVVVRDASDGTAHLTMATDGGLVIGDAANAVTFHLSEVDASAATLDIDGDGTGASISDTMYGIFYEDINYAADGGLYAELVRNRSFEFNSTDNGSFTGLTAWQTLNRSGAGTTVAVRNDDGRLHRLNRNYLELTAAAPDDGIRNIGYNNGVHLVDGSTYDASVWARSSTAQDLTIRVEDNAGTGVLASGSVAVDGSDEWKQYDVELTATATTDAGRLAVLAGAPSTVALDMVSLMPHDTWQGPVNGRSVLRKDLAEKIAAMDPTFLRFPGGCVTNVGTFRSYEESGFTDRQRTYQWKETVGPVEERPTNKNFWGYNQSYGIGYLEYFMFAEDLGAEPLPVVSVGANGCGSQIPEMHDPDLIDRWVQDTVDLIEFANGDTDTEWGAYRAELGHPEPFGLEMIGLGNEENTTTFEANFPAFRDAIAAEYPDIKIISNSGPDSSGARFDTLWDFNRAQEVDLVDEHYYRDPSWFLTNHNRYDSYDREGPKVFLGEYASRGNTFGNALAEASYMTGLERNADVVRLASYAPLLANESHVQWNPDAIWFDNDESWESANWHVQKMFGTNVGDEVVPSTLDADVNQPKDISGGVFLSTWATSAAYDNVTVTSNEDGSTLFSDDFADAAQWSAQRGTWGVDGGRYVQSSTSVTDARSIIEGAYAKEWDNYTLELDATKLGGSEGFLVGFAAQGTDSYYWWNIGGWGNTRSVLQRAAGGAAGEVVAVEGSGVTTGETYRVKVVVEGHTISLYLDDELQMTYNESAASQELFQVVTRDEATGDLVAKVVNTATQPVQTQVVVSDVDVASTATVTEMTAPSTTAINTKTNPDRVVPVTREVSGISGSFDYEFPASSITFIRMHTADATPPMITEVSLSGVEAGGWYADPVTVEVTAEDDRAVDRIEVSVDGGAWTNHSGDTAQVEVSGDGGHTVDVRAVDAQGNVGEIRPLAVNIDATPPVSQAALDPDDRTVQITAADAGAGVERIEYRLGNQADWSTYDDPVAVEQGGTTVRFRSVDRLDNVEQEGALVVPPAGAVREPSVTAAVLVRESVPLGRPATIAVQVSGDGSTPTGPVSVLAGDRVLATGSLAGGRLRLTVPTTDLAVGSHDLTVRYGGDATYDESADALRLLVTRAASRTRVRMRPAAVGANRRAKAKVRVTSTGPQVTGKVRVTVRRAGKRVAARTVTLNAGVGRVRLPRLAPGRYRVRAVYTGSPTTERSAARARLLVRRAR